jgi:intergrase/recombinase
LPARVQCGGDIPAHGCRVLGCRVLAWLTDFGESGLDCASAGRPLARYDLPWFNKGKLRDGISNAVFAWICSAT